MTRDAAHKLGVVHRDLKPGAAFARDLREASRGMLDNDARARARHAQSHDLALDKSV